MCEIAYIFFNDTATTEIYTLSLHDALPIWSDEQPDDVRDDQPHEPDEPADGHGGGGDERSGREQHDAFAANVDARSEEHTSELQSRQYLVCRLLLAKKNYVITVAHRLTFIR